MGSRTDQIILRPETQTSQLRGRRPSLETRISNHGFDQAFHGQAGKTVQRTIHPGPEHRFECLRVERPAGRPGGKWHVKDLKIYHLSDKESSSGSESDRRVVRAPRIRPILRTATDSIFAL
jgi:hypothetical protein